MLCCTAYYETGCTAAGFNMQTEIHGTTSDKRQVIAEAAGRCITLRWHSFVGVGFVDWREWETHMWVSAAQGVVIYAGS